MPLAVARKVAQARPAPRGGVRGRGKGVVRGGPRRIPPTYGMATRVKRANAPASRGTQMSFSAPRTTRISHTEWLDSLTNVQPVYSYSINPGVSSILPWLARIALSFERYRIVSLVFEWVPSCPSTTSGSLTFAFDFDSHDEDPSDIQLMSFVPRKTTNLWMPMVFPVSAADCNRLPWHFTRNGSVLNNEDIKTLDVGKFIVYADGTDPAGQVPPESGKIFIHYVVDFLNPTYETLGVVDCEMPCAMNTTQGANDGTEALPCQSLSLKNLLPYLEAVTPNHNCMVWNKNEPATLRENCMLYKCLRDFEGQLSCTLPGPKYPYQGRTNFYEKVGAWVTNDPSVVKTDVEEDATSTEYTTQPAAFGASFVKQLMMRAGAFLVLTSLRATNTNSGVQQPTAAGNILLRLLLGAFPKPMENLGSAKSIVDRTKNVKVLPPSESPTSTSKPTSTSTNTVVDTSQSLQTSTITLPKGEKEKFLRSLKQ